MALAALFIGPALNARVTVNNSYSHLQRAWSSCPSTQCSVLLSILGIILLHSTFFMFSWTVRFYFYKFWGARVGSNAKGSLFPYIPSPFPSTRCGTGSLPGISLTVSQSTDPLLVWRTLGTTLKEIYRSSTLCCMPIMSIAIDCNWVLKSCFSGEIKSQDLDSECWVMSRWHLLQCLSWSPVLAKFQVRQWVRLTMQL